MWLCQGGVKDADESYRVICLTEEEYSGYPG
jgi:hypothetical protein